MPRSTAPGLFDQRVTTGWPAAKINLPLSADAEAAGAACARRSSTQGKDELRAFRPWQAQLLRRLDRSGDSSSWPYGSVPTQSGAKLLGAVYTPSTLPITVSKTVQ